jgi:hypothetical protein
VSSLWTPSGEESVARQGAPAPGDEEGGDEAAALEEELAEVQRQLLETPASVIIANHCIGLFQLAALHLNQQPANLVDAQLAIDALGAIVEGLGDRLGKDEEPLRDALAQIRLAYVQLKGAGGSPPPPQG